MPDFTKAKVQQSGVSEDLTPYLKLLEPIQPGQRVILPLSADDRPRIVARSMNRAAKQLGKRLARVASNASTVDFRVKPLEVRPANITAEQKIARVAKARSTRLARTSAAVTVSTAETNDFNRHVDEAMKKIEAYTK